MRVLAIDASLRNTGVAIVDANNGKPQSVYFGTIHNKSAMRPSSCLVCIRDRLAELIREHAPDCCALESVIYVQSYKTAIILGAARGAAILAAAENGLPVFEYPPKRIKQSTVGRGGAGKDQVAFMVRALLGLTETPDADAADALAIALTHLRMHEAAARGLPGRNANMNGEANSREPMARIPLGEDGATASQELRPPLCVRWLGRMEFAHALALQEELRGEKTERPLRSKISCFFSNTNRFTRSGARLIDPACPPGRIPRGESGSAHLPHPALFDQPRRASDVSRAGPIDGLSDYRSAAVRPGFA